MARTTNTDTLPFVSSRYELGMLAGQRVRDLNGGAEPIVPTGPDKPTVTALREIATGKLDMDGLCHEMVQSYKTVSEVTEDTIESVSEDPLLREIDAELEGALVADDVMPTAELDNELDDSLDDGAEDNKE
ncbi:hypothetical protein FACS189421_12690 [Bacteroidia bacterium]|nr:hypothetical protein FACS189421_12690 [Bacteroidia bacterium]